MKKVSFRRGVTSNDVNSESHIFSIGTTDASATVLYSDEISSGEIWFLNATVHGYDTDGSNYYFSNLVCVARSDGVSESVVFSDDSGVSWSVGFVLNGSLVQLTVTGDIGTTIDWHLVDLKISRYYGMTVVAVADTISGFAYPGETLTASGGVGTRDWQVDGVSTGETGSTYVVSIYDIGKDIKCVTGGLDSNVLTCWHPSDVAAVKACWLPWLGVYEAVSPDDPAEVGDTIRRWTDSVGGINADQTTGANQVILRDGYVESDGSNDISPLSSGLGIFRKIGSGRIIFSGRDRIPTGGNETHVIATWETSSSVRLSLMSRQFSTSAFRALARRQDGDVSAIAGAASDGDYHVLESFGDFANGFVRLVVDGTVVASTALASGAGVTSDTDSPAASLFAWASVGGTESPLDAFSFWALAGDITATELSQVRRFAMLVMGDSYSGPDIPLV